VAGIKRIDFSNIDATGVSAGQQAVYVAANSRFEFVAADYVAVAGGGGSAPVVLLGQTSTTFASGQGTGSPNQLLQMEKLPFSSDTPTTDIGEVATSLFATGTMSSETDGYYGDGPAANPSTTQWKFYKKSFASSSGAATPGVAAYSNPLHGYSWGINADPANGFWFGRNPLGAPAAKFAYSSDSFTDTGWVTQDAGVGYHHATASSPTQGYIFAGAPGAHPQSSIINYGANRKFNFSSPGSFTYVGDLTTGRYTCGGIQSSTHGYAYGGMATLPGWDSFESIDKFPFSSDVDASLVGNLTVPFAAYVNVGHSGSTTHGYSGGGSGGPADGGTPSYHGDIHKWPFSSDTNSTDVAELLVFARSSSATSV